MKNIGLYVHIPFCESKCYYCDFCSFSDKDSYIEKYIKVLKKEISSISQKNCCFRTIYIGGGTPSIINEKYIKEIFKLFDTTNTKEITIEVNPGTVTKHKLQTYFDVGINRLSIGLQSTNDSLLKEIGRIHTYNDFLETYHMAREIGFKNISVDLMFGLPNQTLENVRESLNDIINLKPEHISTYSLTLEEGTVLYEKVRKNQIKLVPDITERKMYWLIKKQLEEAGYIHYEISNFAKKRFESKHNNWYWEQGVYVGVGLSASSFAGHIRYSNTDDLQEYISTTDRLGNINIQELLDEDDLMREYIMLGLRRIKGVNLNKFKTKFKEDARIMFKEVIEVLETEGLVCIEDNHLKLTELGLDYANITWEEFV
ncbi:MAG: radical SAM family heme chaperone HemW [Oscillospiraceae bacterium]|nr:radical SAM family heme chaperone HemW [Oscillospiraceae bacterium]